MSTNRKARVDNPGMSRLWGHWTAAVLTYCSLSPFTRYVQEPLSSRRKKNTSQGKTNKQTCIILFLWLIYSSLGYHERNLIWTRLT